MTWGRLMVVHISHIEVFHDRQWLWLERRLPLDLLNLHQSLQMVPLLLLRQRLDRNHLHINTCLSRTAFCNLKLLFCGLACPDWRRHDSLWWRNLYFALHQSCVARAWNGLAWPEIFKKIVALIKLKSFGHEAAFPLIGWAQRGNFCVTEHPTVD